MPNVQEPQSIPVAGMMTALAAEVLLAAKWGKAARLPTGFDPVAFCTRESSLLANFSQDQHLHPSPAPLGERRDGKADHTYLSLAPEICSQIIAGSRRNQGVRWR